MANANKFSVVDQLDNNKSHNTTVCSIITHAGLHAMSVHICKHGFSHHLLCNIVLNWFSLLWLAQDLINLNCMAP